MGSAQVEQRDVERALTLVDAMLRVACSPQEVRRRVERILMKCDAQSDRYAFWRLILALVISETTRGPRPSRKPMAAA